MVTTKSVLAGICGAFLLSGAALGGEIETLRVGQAVASLPEIKIYTEILDATGKAVETVTTEQITVTVGPNPVSVTEVKRFDQSAEGIGYIFLVDISKSLSLTKFEQMQKAMNLWLERLRDVDRGAIVSFGESVNIVQDYTSDRQALKNGLNVLRASDNRTQLHQALVKGMELGRRADATLPSRRVIVILSDGEDDFAGGMSREEVLNKMSEDRIPIYAIGFSSNDENLKKLGEFARTSGGLLLDSRETPLATLYEDIQLKISTSYLVRINAADVVGDGHAWRVQLTGKSGDRVLTDGLNVRLHAAVKSVETVEPVVSPPVWFKRIPWWGYVGAGVAFLGLIAVTIGLRRKKARLAAEEAERKRKISEERRQKELEKARVEAERRIHDEGKTVAIPKPKPTLKLKLTVIGGGEEKVFGLGVNDDPKVVGRSRDCDLFFPDDTEISKRHCQLSVEDGYLLISDLNSTNGTLLNGVPVKHGQRVKNGDLLLLGRTELRINF